MKKILATTLMILVLLTLTACGGSDNIQDTVTTQETQNQPITQSAPTPEPTPDSPFDSINLDDLTLIPESVQILIPYENADIHFDGAPIYLLERPDGGVDYVYRNNIDSDNGYRVGLSRVGRSDVIVLLIVRLNDNGDLVGMEYLVPTEIAEKFGF